MSSVCMQINDYAHDLQNANACLTPRCYNIIFHTAIAFVGCTIVGSLVDAIVQITSSEVMAKIVIAITVISVAIQISPTTMVFTAIIAVVSAVVVPNVMAVVLLTAVVILTTIMATVSALTVV